MKRLNQKFVLILSIGLIVFLGTVLVVHRFQIRRNAENLTKRAAAFREDKDFRESARLLERYLQHRPDDSEVWGFLAEDCLSLVMETQDFERRDLAKTYSYLEQALRRDPENHDLRRKAVDFLILIRRTPDVISHINILRDVPELKADPELTVILARSQANSGNVDEALRLLEELIGFDSATAVFDDTAAGSPQTVDAYHLLAFLLRDRGEKELLDKIYDQSIKMNPESAKAYLERGRHRRANISDEDDGTELAMARKDVDEALRFDPSNEHALLVAADMAMLADDLEAAREFLSIGLEQTPNSTYLYVTRSDLARREEGIQASLEWIAKGLEKSPDNTVLVLKRAELELAALDTEAARRSIQQLQRAKTRREWIDYLDVRLLMMEGEWLQAAEKLEGVRAELIDNNPHLRPQVYVSLVQCYEKLQKWDMVIQAANEVPNDSSARLTALLAKATAFHRTRQFEKSRQHFDLVLDFYQKRRMDLDQVVLLSYFRMLLDQQQRLPGEKKDWSRTKDVLKMIVEDEKIANVQKAAAKAQFVAAFKDMETARKWLMKEAEKENDEDIRALALRLEPQAADVEPTAADISTLRGRLQKAEQVIRANEENVLEQLAELEQGVDDWSNPQKVALWKGFTRGYMVLRSFDDVFRLWMKIAELSPNDLDIRRRYFDLGRERSDEAKMNEGLDMMANVVGKDSTEWRLAEATRLTWRVSEGHDGREQLETVDRMLREIYEERPNWPLLLRARATVAMVQGDVDNAVENLEQALDNGQNDINLVQQLADIYIKANRKSDALRVLDSLDIGQRSPLVRRWILALQDEKVSVDEVDAVVPTSSENINDLIWRGQLLAQHGHLEQAHNALVRVCDLQPQNPQSWVALVDFLLGVRQREHAMSAMEKAQANLPEHVVNVTLAHCYKMAASRGAPTAEQRGVSIRKAESFYQEALASSSEEPQLIQDIAAFYLGVGKQVEAEKYLDKLLVGSEGYQEVTPARIAWARRSKARVLASSGSYQDYLQAIDLIRQNAPHDEQIGSADLKVMAEITLPRPDPLSHKRIIKELEGIQESRSLTIVESTFLARLYQRVNRFNDAEGVLFRIAAANPNHQVIVSLLVETLLKQDKYNDAENWLNKLPENSLNRYRIRALMLSRKGQPDQAARELVQLIPSKLAPEQHELLRNIASLLEEINQYDIAEKLWRKYTELEPQNHLMLASFLGRCEGLDRLQQAFEMCDEAVKAGESRMEGIAQIGVSSLRKHMEALDEAGEKSQYFDVVAQWFQAGRQRSPQSKSLKLQEAEFETLRGNTDVIVGIYRKFLTREDLDNQQRALVKNNLAYMLAINENGKEALGLVSDAMTFLGPTPHLLDTRAMAKIALGKYSDAQHDLSSALDEGESASLRFHLAYANYMDRDLGSAEQEMRQAIELGINPHIMHPAERKIYNRIINDLDLQSLAMN